MKKWLVLAVVSLSLGLVGCSSKDTKKDQEPPKTVSLREVETGKDIKLPYNPKKVAVLDMATLDIMDRLGVGDRIAGLTKKSKLDYLESYLKDDNKIKHLGSEKEADMEALYELKPDVIIIGGRLEDKYVEFSKIAPTFMLSVDRPTGFMKSYKINVENMGKLFGKEEEAKKMLDKFDSRVEELHKKAKGKNAFIGMVTGGSLSSIGNKRTCSIITDEIGFENVSKNVQSPHGDATSFELLLEKNPDYIFILDRDQAIQRGDAKPAKDIMENEIVMKTNAYKNKHMVYLTPAVWYMTEGGITAMETMLNDLENGIK